MKRSSKRSSSTAPGRGPTAAGRPTPNVSAAESPNLRARGTSRNSASRLSRAAGLALAAAVCFGPAPVLRADPPLTPEAAAAQTLNAARRAYNEKAYPAATEKFREFLKTYGGNKETPSAQYGLALCLLEGPEKDYTNAWAALQQANVPAGSPEKAFVLYYSGVARRGLGNAELAKGAANPGEAPQRKAAANVHFDDAARQFAAAAQAFSALAAAPAAPTAPPAQSAPAAGAGPSAEAEWAGRARCDAAEMLLKLGKAKEAAEAVAPFLADAKSAASSYRPLALYYQGYASFIQKDYTGAGRALGQLAPFNQEFGPHAHYLLARAHHLAGEKPEAEAHYKAVIAAYDEQKKAAQAALQNAAALKDKPEQKAFYEALVNGPAPNYLTRANFYWGVLAFEAQRFDEAQTRFAPIAQNAKTPLQAEAQLRQGFCFVELHKFPEANAVLGPLTQNPQFADQAHLWIARAQVGAATAGYDAALQQINAQPGILQNPPAYQQATQQAMNGYVQGLAPSLDNFRKAADRASELAAKLAASGAPEAQEAAKEAKARRGEILLELADTQQAARQYKEAAATYAKVIAENLNPDRNEEATQRQAVALHLAGQYAESDQVCQKFAQAWPNSTLLASVLFRSAENAYLAANATAAKGEVAGATREQQTQAMAAAKPQYEEAIKRYAKVVEKYPEFPYVNLAKQGLATAHYRLGHYPEAIAVLETIPEADRNGDLATVPYLQADALIRTLAADAPDALEANRMDQTAGDAAKLLETYVGSQPKSPQTPDAYLKLAHCYSRIGSMVVLPAERKRVLALARENYDKLLSQFPKEPLIPTAIFERAKCLALQGDAGTAFNDLNKFTQEPLRSSTVAPLAMVRLSSMLRSQNKPADADKLLAQVRPQVEPALLKDPARADWVPQLQYEHALAIREAAKQLAESGAADAPDKSAAKLAEASALFESIVKTFPGKPEAVNAAWRVGQCKREALTAQLAAAAKQALDPSAKPEKVAAANAAVAKATAGLKETTAYFQAQADEAGKKTPGSEAQQNLLYELAWCQRALADGEIVAAAQKKQQEALAKPKASPGEFKLGDPAQTPKAPEIVLADLPVQPAEQAARDAYKKLITVAPESPLSVEARLELAEMFAAHNDLESAVKLLSEAWEKDPPTEVSERIKLRMAACYLAKNDAKSAQGLADAVTRNSQSKYAPEARYLTGEALFQQQQWPAAIEQLLPFRDKDTLRNVPAISDRALLRLGQAYAQANQWDASRQTLEALVGRYPQSPWIDEARYAIGWAYQAQKQYDPAVNQYAEVVKRTAAEVAARAQLQIGLCRLEQNRPEEAVKALLAVPLTYDYAEPSATAWCEAGRAYVALKKPAEATKALQRVMKDHPSSRWAQVAQERLTTLK